MTGFMVFVCIGASMYNLAAIAINRLLYITKPVLYKKVFTSWKLVVLVAIPWIVPGGSVILVLATGYGAVGYDERDSTCNDLDAHEKAEVFTSVQFLSLPITLTAIVVSYVWIYIFLKRHFRTQKQNIPDLELCTEISVCDNSTSTLQANESSQLNLSSPNAQRRNKISKQQIQITKNLFLVVCAFFICFTPFFLILPFENTSVGIHIAFYFKIFVYANSAINFMIYAHKHPDFKVVFRHMIRCSYADIPKPSKILLYLISKK